jgi:chromosomal replication initiator protein
VKAEEFTNELIISIQRNQTQEFRNQYRNLDLLLFDDLQFLEGKKTCQEEFLYTFDALISAGAKVIITSQKNIDEIKLSSNLNNKLKSSLISQISSASFTDRVSLIISKSQASNIEISTAYAETIARKYPESIRELEAALYQLSAHKNFAGEDIDDELIARLFGGVSHEPANKGLSIEKISNAVADYFSLKNKELIGKTRVQDVTRARHLAIYLSHELLEISYSRIGEYFGGRKHSSIIHSIKTVNGQLQSKLPSANATRNIILDIKSKI